MTTFDEQGENPAHPSPPKRKRSASETRKRIIRAARTLIAERGYANVSLDDIASAADISRQTLYLQFGSKIGILHSIVDDEESGLAELQEAMRGATGPLDLIKKAIPLDVILLQKNYKLFRVFLAQSFIDPEFRVFWDHRMQGRRASMRRAIEWLDREGKLADGWNVDEATDWFFTVTDFSVYDHLVVKSGWTIEQLQRRLLQVVLSTLVKAEQVAGQFPS